MALDLDETVILVARKHRVFLLTSLLLPVLALLALLVAGSYYGLGVLVGAFRFEGLLRLFLYFVPLATLGLLLWLYLAYREWENDQLILTDRRVVVVRHIYRIFEERQEAPLSRIQDIRITVPGVFASLLGYGNLSIATASAQSRLEFNGLSRPNAVKEAIFRIREMALRQERDQRREDIRERLERELG